MGGEREELVIVDDAAVVDLAEDGGFHAVVEYLLRHAPWHGQLR